MIYLDLFLGFLRVGCFAFGGSYGAIPLIRDVVLSYGWLTEDSLTNMIAVSESTPGPIMVNLATYVGSRQGGILGAILATFAVVLPSFVIILLVFAALKAVWAHPVPQAALGGLTPCIIGIVLATGLTMILSNLSGAGGVVGWREAALTAVLAAVLFGAKPLFKRSVSPIALILLAAVLGMVVYGF